MGMGSISIRSYIRWPPAATEEPTSTLVLTSPGRRFVDLRILIANEPIPGDSRLQGKDDKGKDEQQLQAIMPLSRLDWAIAGTSSSWLRHAADGSGGHVATVSHSRWTHWIDSRTPENPEEVIDEGDMFPQPDGTTLEKGCMPNPATGRDADYEELWVDTEPLPNAAAKCVVLQLDDPASKARGMVVILGQFCQGLSRLSRQQGEGVGGESEIAAQRWEWNEGGGWTMTARIGSLDLPCRVVIDRSSSLTLGQELRHGGHIWKVVEVAER